MSVVPPLYKTTSIKGHFTYQARLQMISDSKILLNCPLERGYPSYKTTLQKGLPYKRETTV